jgi:hypothetical protein
MRQLNVLTKLAAITALAMTCVGTARAITDSGSWGRNRLNQTVFILNDIITFKNDANGRRTDEEISVVPFEGECVWVGQPATTDAYALDCRHGTLSPLAGGYFKIRFSKSHKNECRRGTTIYECTIGCRPHRVPAVFVEEPYEC